MKNKYIEAPKEHEIKCVGIRLLAPKKMVDSKTNEFTAEGTEFLQTVDCIGKKHKYLGITPQMPYVYVLFRLENCIEATKFFEELNGKYDAKLVKNSIFVDERYFQEEFKNCPIQLPPQEMIDAIKKLMSDYSSTEISREDDALRNLIIYRGDLGFREFVVIIGQGGKYLSCGIANGKAHISKNALVDYKAVLNVFENDLAAWLVDHPGMEA